MRVCLALLALLCLVLPGCDEDPGDPVDIEQACVDVGHELGLAGERCGLWTYTEGRDAWTKQIGGDCSKATEVRDYDELYEQCLPWLQSAECMALDNNLLDSSCKEQILY